MSKTLNYTKTIENHNKFTFNALLSEFFKIWLIYIFKCIITLGIYSFWGATKVRSYVTNKFSLAGESFVYSGTPKELFQGFIIIFMIIKCPVVIAYLISLANILSSSPDYEVGYFYLIADYWSIISSFIFLCMYPYFILKYRASRTSWKGVKGNLKANVWKYCSLSILSILTLVSLNIFAPYMDLKRKSYIWNNMFFGMNKFNSTAKYKPLMNINIITTILLIPTLGISRIWYYAALDRHIYSGIEISGLKMKSTVSGWNLTKLVIGNILLFVISLSLTTPLIIKRNIKFYIDNHSIIGDLSCLNLTAIEDNSKSKDYSFYKLFGSMGMIDSF